MTRYPYAYLRCKHSALYNRLDFLIPRHCCRLMGEHVIPNPDRHRKKNLV